MLDFLRPKMTPVKGTVERFGPSFGHGQIDGYILLLAGQNTPYVILRDDHLCDTTAGLTIPGDFVEFLASKTAHVGLSSFSNVTLAARLADEMNAAEI